MEVKGGFKMPQKRKKKSPAKKIDESVELLKSIRQLLRSCQSICDRIQYGIFKKD